jgi:hypothetical protein
MSTCYLHHKIPLALPIPKQSTLTLPTYSPIAYRPLSILSVEISTHHRTTSRFIYSLLSTPYCVSTINSNKQPKYVLLNCEVRSCKHCYCGNAVIISVTLVKHRSFTCPIMSPVACRYLQSVSTLSHKPNDFQNKVTEHKMCVLVFNTILSKIFTF